MVPCQQPTYTKCPKHLGSLAGRICSHSSALSSSLCCRWPAMKQSDLSMASEGHSVAAWQKARESERERREKEALAGRELILVSVLAPGCRCQELGEAEAIMGSRGAARPAAAGPLPGKQCTHSQPHIYITNHQQTICLTTGQIRAIVLKGM